MSLLDNPQPANDFENIQIARARVQALQQKLESLRIACRVNYFTFSPAFTTLRIKNGEETSMREYNNIDLDVMQALAVSSVRILNPIPGTKEVGVEVPNAKVNPVYLKELLIDEEPNKSILNVPFGKPAMGRSLFYDVAKQGPHMLVAGATGSGKSVFLNTFIISLLLKATPDELKFVIIDPKMVEFSVYNDIPHLACPIITESSEASILMKRLVVEMGERYHKLKLSGCRDIKEYNERIRDKNMPLMPYLVCIIDEYAELIGQDKSIEDSIARLGQMARAAGIHLVVALQKPTVDVISGKIKSNILLRVAFHVAAGKDSEVILDSRGAEKLFGNGDMLVSQSGGEPTRAQGAYISMEEINRVVEACKIQRKPDYFPQFLDLVEKTDDGDGVSLNDEDKIYFDRAKKFVLSKSFFTKTNVGSFLGVGAGRADKIVMALLQEGVIIQDNRTGKYNPNPDYIE
ncbi:MAG: hypothetical protein LBM99_04995 [Bacillales bacterium]|nr:hypothetical protein [Bacillales bacterium]